MSNVLTTFFSGLAMNRTANQLAKKYGMKFGASRFVAGDQLADALRQVQTLNDNGMAAMLNYLGEFVDSKEEANSQMESCLDILDAIYTSGLNCNLTVKPTSLGLTIGKEVALTNLQKIVERAKQYKNFVRIEAEDYANAEAILDLYKELRQTYDNTGTVIQAYLYRAEQDVHDLNQYKANLRLVKGAYKESPKVAFPNKADVDKNYEKLIKIHLLNGNYTGIATHDERIIGKVIEFAKEKGIPKDQFEFQMLYGIRPQLQWDLARDGYKMRVYVPFGTDWFGYFMRRLAERPENAAFVLKSFYKK